MTQTPEKGEHKGYAVFLPDGAIYLPSVQSTEADAIDRYTGAFAWERNYVPRGYTVRPVLITEIEE